MFRKLFAKLVGKTLAPVLDEVAVEVIDKATGGAASKAERIARVIKEKN